MFDYIVVAVDGSEQSQRAASLGGDLSGRLGARLTLVHAVQKHGSAHMPKSLKVYDRLEHVHRTVEDVLEEAANEILEVAGTRAGAEHRTAVLFGDPAEQIVAYGKEHDAGLIVMGERGLGGLTSALIGALIGSVSHKVLHGAPCPVLITR